MIYVLSALCTLGILLAPFQAVRVNRRGDGLRVRTLLIGPWREDCYWRASGYLESSRHTSGPGCSPCPPWSSWSLEMNAIPPS